jgi:inositol-hexakisphosphate kinase
MELHGFKNQVGGHFGLLQCGGHVAKPLNSREMAFYEIMSDDLRQFTPEYCGRVRVIATLSEERDLHLVTDRQMGCHKDITIRRTDSDRIRFRVGKTGRVEINKECQYWAATCQSKAIQKLLEGQYSSFIVLENVVFNYQKPCILDLKLGTRQHSDDATEEKRDRQLKKCQESTSAALGVRMVGMKLYESRTKTYSFVDKQEGRRMTKDEFRGHLQRFARCCGKLRTARLRKRLNEIKETVLQSDGYRFFSSSLLISFDSAQLDSTNERSIGVYMIDFANSTFGGFPQDKKYEGVDEGYILGLNSLLAALETVPTTPEQPLVVNELLEVMST